MLRENKYAEYGVCYLCGKQALFWESRFQVCFCSDKCYEKLMILLDVDYDYRTGQRSDGERKTIQSNSPVVKSTVQGDFKISGSVVTLVQQETKIAQSTVNTVPKKSKPAISLDFEEIMAAEKRRKDLIASMFTKDKKDEPSGS